MLNRIVISLIALLLGKTETMLLLARVLEQRGETEAAREIRFSALWRQSQGMR